MIMYFFLLSFLILGGGIKYIDAAYDDKTFNKKLALAIAPVLGILWAYTMLINEVAATILFAVLLGVLLKGKIDNRAHLVGLLIIFGVIFLMGVELLFLPLIFLAAAALLDEVGNDVVDYNKKYLKSKNKLLHKFLIYFFDQRWLLKIAILAIALIGIIPIFFFLAILLFDYAYLTVHSYSQFKQGTLDTWLHLKMSKISDIVSSRRIVKENIIKDQYSA